MWKAITFALVIAGLITWLTEKPKDQSRRSKTTKDYNLPLTTVPAPTPWQFNWYQEGQLI